MQSFFKTLALIVLTGLGLAFSVLSFKYGSPLFAIHSFEKEYSFWPNSQIVEFHTDIGYASKQRYLNMYRLQSTADAETDIYLYLPTEGIDAFEDGYNAEEGFWIQGLKSGHKIIAINIQAKDFEVPSDILIPYINRLQLSYALTFFGGLILFGIGGFRLVKRGRG
jgi:hypothetical protein